MRKTVSIFCSFNHSIYTNGAKTIPVKRHRVFDIIEDSLPEKIALLSEGKAMELELAESCLLILKFVPFGKKINCQIREFGYSSESNYVELDKNQVLAVLRRFLDEVMQLAVKLDYISLENKEEFIAPAFPSQSKYFYSSN